MRRKLYGKLRANLCSFPITVEKHIFLMNQLTVIELNLLISCKIYALIYFNTNFIANTTNVVCNVVLSYDSKSSLFSRNDCLFKVNIYRS